MSKHLADMGYSITIIVPNNPEYTQEDSKLLQEINKKINVIKHNIWEVRRLFSKSQKKASEVDDLLRKDDNDKTFIDKISLWIRANIFIPDARMPWYFQIRNKVVAYVNKHKPDVLITSGTPHTLHLIGHYAKQKTSIKWIADFRDPWTNIEYYKNLPLTQWADKQHRKLEKKILTSADQVVTVSPTWAKEMSTFTSKPAEVIYNGFEKFFTDKSKSKEAIIIRHLGTMNADRNPESFWRAIAKAKQEGLWQRPLFIELYGKVSKEVTDSIVRLDLTDIVSVKGVVSHHEARSLMASATYLLLPINKNKSNQKGRIPAKLFEYLASGRPIIQIGSEYGDAAGIINELNAGRVLPDNDIESINKTIVSMVNDGFAIEVDKHEVKNYSRASQAEQYASIIERIMTK